jgi:phosphoribosylanthranilate isomerase
MQVKICGLKYSENIKQIAALNVDMLGFIFYKKTVRYVADDLDASMLKNLPKHIKKVAVFVDESLDNILTIQKRYAFDFIQLHGNESSEFCKQLQESDVKIIKAFSVDENFDFTTTTAYEPYCSYFLFDTKGKEKGGNGFAFDWKLLESYQGNFPFLLSGGIGADNIHDVLELKHSQLAGIDFNSKIETTPAVKSVEQAKYILNQLKKCKEYDKSN